MEINEINEDDSVTEDDDSLGDLELLSDIASSEPYGGEMEQLELLTDDDSDATELYQQLLCLEDMDFVNIATTPSSSNGLVFSGEFRVRRQLFYFETTSSSSSSDESD